MLKEFHVSSKTEVWCRRAAWLLVNYPRFLRLKRGTLKPKQMRRGIEGLTVYLSSLPRHDMTVCWEWSGGEWDMENMMGDKLHKLRTEFTVIQLAQSRLLM